MVSREKSLAKNTIIITIGKICTQMITFLLLPLYTGILSTTEYGIVDLLNTLVSLLLPIITFQIYEALFRELLEVRQNNKMKMAIISSAYGIVTIQCIIYVILFLIISPIINNEYKMFLATNVVAFVYSNLTLETSRGLGFTKNYSIASFISAITTIILNILFLVVFKSGVNGMLISTMVGQLSSTIYLFISLNLFKYIRVNQINKKIIIRLWKYSIPLIPNAISWWVFGASDRVIVSSILGLSMNGILSAASKFSGVYIMFYNIFNLSWTESISLHINDKDIDSYFNKMLNVILKFFSALCIIIIACMPIVYNIMINSNYSSGYLIVPILILASLFNVIVGLVGVVYVAKKNTKAIAVTSVIAAILNIVIHLILINYVGLYAAAVSTLISYVILCIYRIYDINMKYFKIVIEKEFIIKTIATLIPILFMYYLNNIYFVAISILIAIIYSVVINKNSFGEIYRILIKKISNKKKEM